MLAARMSEQQHWPILTIRVPPDWLDEIKAVAQDRAISVAALVRMALRSFLHARLEQ